MSVVHFHFIDMKASDYKNKIKAFEFAIGNTKIKINSSSTTRLTLVFSLIQ